MSQFVYKELACADPKVRRRVPKKLVTGSDGTTLVVYTVNADLPTFEHDLTHAFTENVKRVRRKHRSQVQSASDVAAER